MGFKGREGGGQQIKPYKPDVAMLTFDPSAHEAKAVDLREFKASLVYIVSSRTARTSEILSPPSPLPQ